MKLYSLCKNYWFICISSFLVFLFFRLCKIINEENPSEPSEDPIVEIEWYYFALLATKPCD